MELRLDQNPTPNSQLYHVTPLLDQDRGGLGAVLQELCPSLNTALNLVCNKPFVGTRACSGIPGSRRAGGFPGALQAGGENQRLLLRNPWLRDAPCTAPWGGYCWSFVPAVSLPDLRTAGKGKFWAVRGSLASPSAACSAPGAAERGGRGGEAGPGPCTPGLPSQQSRLHPRGSLQALGRPCSWETPPWQNALGLGFFFLSPEKG